MLIGRYPRLPNWCLTGKMPGFYDTESATTIEQIAKLYKHIQGLTDDYNKWVCEVNQAIEDFEKDVTQDFECFKTKIIEITENYTETITLKIEHQDRRIEDLHIYVKENIATYLTDLMNQMKDAGELDQIILNSLEVLTNKFTELETEVNSILDSKISEMNSLISEVESVKTDIETTKTDVENLINETDEKFEEFRSKSISYCKSYKSTFITNVDPEDTFPLPEGYSINSILNVYINGFKLNSNEYIVDSENLLLKLSKSVDVPETVVEIEVLKMTVANEEDYDTLKGLSAYEVACKNGFEGTESEWLASLLTSYLRTTTYFKTETDSENTFELPTNYSNGSIVDVFVNGMKLNNEEYSIQESEGKYSLILTNTLDVVGTVIEVNIINI